MWNHIVGGNFFGERSIYYISTFRYILCIWAGADVYSEYCSERKPGVDKYKKTLLVSKTLQYLRMVLKWQLRGVVGNHLIHEVFQTCTWSWLTPSVLFSCIILEILGTTQWNGKYGKRGPVGRTGIILQWRGLTVWKNGPRVKGSYHVFRYQSVELLHWILRGMYNPAKPQWLLSWTLLTWTCKTGLEIYDNITWTSFDVDIKI